MTPAMLNDFVILYYTGYRVTEKPVEKPVIGKITERNTHIQEIHTYGNIYRSWVSVLPTHNGTRLITIKILAIKITKTIMASSY